MMFSLNNFLFIFNGMVLFTLLLIYIFFDFYLDEEFIFFSLLGLAVLIFSFIIKDEREAYLRKNFLKHSVLFLIGFIVVSFQKYLDYYLGYIDKHDLLFGVSEISVTKSILLSLLGLVAFFMGYLINGNNSNKSNNKINNYKYANTSLLTVLNLIFICGFLFNLNPLYVFGGYGIYDMGLNAVYFSVLFKAGFFSIVIQKIINIHKTRGEIVGFFNTLKYFGLFNIFLLILYLSVVLLSGDRGDIILFSLLFLFFYFNVTGVKISRIKSIIMICIAAFFITILGVARSFNTLEEISFIEKISKSLAGETNKKEEPSILSITSELSGSVKALHYSVEFVPKSNDYLYSRFYAHSLLGVIPLSSYLNDMIFDDNSEKFLSSDSYVTWLIEGENPTTGHGTSIVADFYLSFGVLGVVVGMLLVGWLFRYAEKNMIIHNNRYLIVLIISVVLFCSSIYLARSSILSSLRLVIWIWVLMYINTSLSKRLFR